MSEDNGWGEYKMSVMHQLEFLTAEVHSLRDTVTDLDKNMCTEIAVLKTKAGTWGAVAGALGAVIVTVIGQLVIHALTK
jgi:hypothetical protein